jgi:hypothetical protein
MEGIGLDNMLGAEEVEKLFSDPAEPAGEPAASVEEANEPPASNNDSKDNKEPSAEVDFSDLLGNQPESVGSEKEIEGNGGAPESSNDSGTQQQNLFSSIAKALRDEGVFPDLSDDTLKEVTDAASLKKMFESEATRTLDDITKRLNNALNGGATPDELQQYQQAMNLNQYLNRQDTFNLLTQEGDDGEKLRKQMMYEDYVKIRGFKHDRAVKMIQKSFDEGTDIDDAKDAYESCKEYYRNMVDGYQHDIEDRQQHQKAEVEKQYANLKKNILDRESFYDGVKVDKALRQKAYDSITKPVYKDEQGNYLTALQKYQRENPIEFMENVALLYALTGEFKSVDRLAKDKAKAKIKSSFDEVANVLNNYKRNGDGTLNLANTPIDDREGWSLAI